MARFSRVGPKPESLVVTQADIQPTFGVDKRALKVFNVIFFTPSTSNQPGEIQWLDVVCAMISTVFSAEKLYGSVWQWSHTKLDVERNIQFHEPHPTGKIPYMMARTTRRRLTGHMVGVAESLSLDKPKLLVYQWLLKVVTDAFGGYFE